VPNIKQLANLSEDTVQAKLKKNVEKYRKYLSGYNDKVPSKIQQLFNDLARQYDCEWKDENVIYFKEFNMSIMPPYGPSNCAGGSNDKARDRVKHILAEFESKKQKI